MRQLAGGNHKARKTPLDTGRKGRKGRKEWSNKLLSNTERLPPSTSRARATTPLPTPKRNAQSTGWQEGSVIGKQTRGGVTTPLHPAPRAPALQPHCDNNKTESEQKGASEGRRAVQHVHNFSL
jgi:hypothetical protein